MTKLVKFKFLAHTADRKFQAFGKTLEEVFENSALALFNIVYGGKIKNKIKFKIHAKGRDLENLMYNFLEEFLVLIDGNNFLPFKIINFNLDTPRKGTSKKAFKIKAEVVGDNAKNYNVSEHVKAITYNEMFIKKINGKWTSQVVLDI